MTGSTTPARPRRSRGWGGPTPGTMVRATTSRTPGIPSPVDEGEVGVVPGGVALGGEGGAGETAAGASGVGASEEEEVEVGAGDEGRLFSYIL